MKSLVILFFVIWGIAARADKYQFEIIKPYGKYPHLVAASPLTLAGQPIFKLIVSEGDQKGFNSEMMTIAAYEAGYDFIEFIPRPWNDVLHSGKTYISLLEDLDNDVGDAVAANIEPDGLTDFQWIEVTPESTVAFRKSDKDRSGKFKIVIEKMKRQKCVERLVHLNSKS